MTSVRAAARSDLALVAELEKRLFPDAWTESMLEDCLKQKHYRIIVCGDGEDGVDGYLISTHVAGDAELLRIGVAPEKRRRGIGRRLMESFAGQCAGLETPSAFLEVRASNRGAILLYRQFGFETVGVRKRYYHHPEEDALLMSSHAGNGLG